MLSHLHSMIGCCERYGHVIVIMLELDIHTFDVLRFHTTQMYIINIH